MTKKFTGKLAKHREPRIWPSVGATLILDEEAKSKAIAKCDSEFKKMSMDCYLEDFKNLLLLCDHYGIERPTKADETGASHVYMLSRLSIKLAEELKIPAFTEKYKRGRKNKWTDYNMALLIASVSEKVEAKKSQNKEENEEKLISWACELLSKQDPWKNFLSVGEETIKSDALRKKYYEAKKSKISKALGEALSIGARAEKDLFKSILKETL